MNALLADARLLATPLVLAHGHFDFATWSVGEWILFGSAAALTVWILWIAVRMTVSPGETAPDHVKRSILDDDETPAGLSIRVSPPRV